MAVASILEVGRLDAGWVLAPERYDPRRRGEGRSGVPLGSLAEISRETVAPGKAPLERYVVLDTGDAREGIVTAKRPVAAGEMGSAKKLLRAGDVIVSRLRPYLRQVALVDAGPALGGGAEPVLGGGGAETGGGAGIACSTEFHVLRRRGDASIAFLVAFLLSDGAQSALAAGVEGGHHPRFSQAALEELVVPDEVLAAREDLSARVEAAIAAARRGERELAAAIAIAGSAGEGEVPRLAA
jgi:hypothetical protein